MIAWTNYETGNHRTNCPACGRKANDKTLGITVDADGHGVAHCFRCSYVETHRPDAGTTCKPGKPINRPVQAAKHETLSEYGLELWSACRPLSGVALAYLEARRCAVPPEDSDLRYHQSLKHPSGYVGPALVGLVTDAVSNQPLSLHRTWIVSTGKAVIDPPRMLLGGHRKQGGVIRLWADEWVAGGLAITEGVETGLSLAHGYQPVWACIDAGNLAAFPVLNGITTLVIGADNDPAGNTAAATCAARWAAAGKTVYVTQQKQNDLNDVVTEATQNEC